MPPEFPVQDLLSILCRRRRAIIATAVIGTALVFLGSLMLPPKYTATAQIVFEPQTAYSGDGRPIIDQAAEQAVLQTHIAALTSRAYLQSVLDSLSRDPNFGTAASPISGGARSNGDVLQLGLGAGPQEGAARLLGAKKTKSQSSAEAESEARRLDRFERRLNVYQQHGSHVIAVAFSATDPRRAALTANRVAQLYIESREEQERTQINRAARWLEKRIPQVRAGFEQAALGPEAAAAGQVYVSLLQRREQLRTQQEVTPSELRILSLAAPPDRPSSPGPLLFVLPALILFCAGGSFLAVALERFDRGLHSAQDVNAALGIPCIGFVPLLPCGGKARPHEHLLRNPFSAYTEAIRSLVAALQLTAPERAPKVILISSSVANEGKTTLAVSLAVYNALIGRRALLVDLDFRNPTVSRELGGRAATGVLDALWRDDRSMAEAIRRAPGLDLDYLPASGGPGDPLRPFVGGHVPRLLHRLRDGYDCIVIDSPPLLGVAEARLLVAMADKVLLAVKWGSTRRDVARDAANLLRDFGLADENGCRRIGAVLMQVDLQKHAQYRYGGWESIRAALHAPKRGERQ
jgi:succinoglycan biosynthesis transport protein ExoP